MFHFSARTGWLNDPNGFSMYQGECHLFYQYYPYGVHWGSMHWGHAKSKDFITWDYLPAALAPDQDYDRFGVFSGGAIEADGKHYLMYTGVVEEMLPDGRKRTRQNQCLAAGDGRNYEKSSLNPVITASLLPEGSSRKDFRDPKIWREDGRFYAVAGSRHADGSGQIPLFVSEDLSHWKFCSILDRSENRYGRMWECPDFFPLGDKKILMVSPQEMEAEGLEFHNGNNNLFLAGDYDKVAYKFNRLWAQSWDNHIYPQAFAWSGLMTVPRELFLADGRVCQRPVRELE